MGQNYPNPVADKTKIEFLITDAVKGSLKIADITGKVVATPVHRILPTGIHSVELQAGQFPEGIYFYRLDFGKYASTKKMIMNK